MSESGITIKSFFDGVRAGTLTGIRCGTCRELAVPPKEFCPACGARAWHAEALSGEGTIASYTIIRVAPARHAADAPYAIAVVRLTDGVQLLGRVVDIPLEQVAVGLPVRFRPLTRNGHTTIAFGPA
ncbi:MAG: Zn-ribbon domain-containing OB-fold protein [Candidatus Rokuibacteriota bacterium]